MACITKRRDRWIIDFYDQHGKRRWKTLKEGTTKKRAKKVLREIEEKVEKGDYTPSRNIPSFSEVADMWLSSKQPNIRHSTYGQYKGHVEKHLKEFYGIIQITKINYDSVEKFIKHLKEVDVSIPTSRKILTTLGSIMRYACRKKYTNHNPVREIEKPKGQSEHKEDEEMNILNPVQIRELIEAVGWYGKKNKKTGKITWHEISNLDRLKYQTLVMTDVFTGMREGEILGLKWIDIDWFNNQIHVKRTFNYSHFYDPKTKTSRRKIDMAPQLVAQLKKWRLACPLNELDLVFPNGEGNPINASNLFNRVFLQALKKAKFKRMRFHDLRHTYASLLIEQGENPKYIQKQMGHASITITYDTYGHLMKDTNPEAARKLGNTIFGENGSKMVAKAKQGFHPKR